jgi:hypothetical protein
MDSKLELGIFQNKLRSEINDYKLCAIDSLDNFIVIGDEKGNILSYQINQNGILALDYEQFVAKGKIDQIKCLPNLNLVYVVLGGCLYGYQLPRLDLKFKFESKDLGAIHLIALNGHQNCQNQVLIVSKKRKVKCYEYNPEITKLIDMKVEDLKVFDLTDSIEWYGNWFCYAVKKKVFTVNVIDGVSLSSDLESSCIKNVKGSWLIYTNSLGIFMENNQPKQINPILFSSKPLVTLGVYKNFIISVHDSLIGIFDSNDSQQVQEIQIQHGSFGKFLSIGNKKVFYVLSSFSEKKDSNSFQIWELVELAYEMQINKLLNDGKIDDALNILNNNISSSNEDKPKKIEQFFIDCSWSCLKKSEFEKAYQYGKMTNFNPFEFTYLFKDQLKIKILHEEFKNSTNLPTIDSLTSSNDLLSQAFKMLTDLLNDKRNYFLSLYEIPKDNNKKIIYLGSEHSLINLSTSKSDFSLEVVSEFINTTLIKLLVRRQENAQKIWQIVDTESFKCDWEDLDSFLIKQNNDLSRIAYAYLCEKKEKFEDALKIWQDYGNKDNSNAVLSREAMDRTKIILKKSKEKRLFHDYIQWILIKYPTQAFDLFLTTDIIPADYFFSTIIGAVEKIAPNNNLKEKFLEYYIENGCTNERYHTILAENYIEKLFKIKKSETPYEPQLLEGNLKTYVEKLDKLLKTSQYLNKNHILEKIEGSWMIDQEIFLYSKLNMHNSALDKLIKLGIDRNDFSKAEAYCAEMIKEKPDLFAQLFIILSKEYNSNLNLIKNSRTEAEKKILDSITLSYQKEMLNILRKYGDQGSLDPFVVLNELPVDWIISDQSLYDYLTKIMKTHIHMSNKYKVAKSLSEVALIHKEKEILDIKDKSVTISNETVCDLCRKKIGNSIFCVYPNMKVYHQKCTQNLTICPTTRADFSKKQIL